MFWEREGRPAQVGPLRGLSNRRQGVPPSAPRPSHVRAHGGGAQGFARGGRMAILRATRVHVGGGYGGRRAGPGVDADVDAGCGRARGRRAITI